MKSNPEAGMKASRRSVPILLADQMRGYHEITIAKTKRNQDIELRHMQYDQEQKASRRKIQDALEVLGGSEGFLIQTATAGGISSQ